MPLPLQSKLLLTTISQQDGEIFEEDCSLDAAIAAKDLSDLQRQEQLSLDDFDTLENMLHDSITAATKERADIAAALSIAEAALPEQDDATVTEGKIRKQHKKHYTTR